MPFRCNVTPELTVFGRLCLENALFGEFYLFANNVHRAESVNLRHSSLVPEIRLMYVITRCASRSLEKKREQQNHLF